MRLFSGLLRPNSRLLACAVRPVTHRSLFTTASFNIMPVSIFSSPLKPSHGMNVLHINRIGAVRTMANHRHKKIIKLAKGFRGRANRCFRTAVRRVQKARKYAYIGRKLKKRDMRSLWIQRMNAACRIYGITYNNFIHRLSRSSIKLNRKVLSDLANTEPLSFRSIIDVVQKTNGK